MMRHIKGTSIVEMYDPEQDDTLLIKPVTDRARLYGHVIDSGFLNPGTPVIISPDPVKYTDKFRTVVVDDCNIVAYRSGVEWIAHAGWVILELHDVDPYDLATPQIARDCLIATMLAGIESMRNKTVICKKPARRYIRADNFAMIPRDCVIAAIGGVSPPTSF